MRKRTQLPHAGHGPAGPIVRNKANSAPEEVGRDAQPTQSHRAIMRNKANSADNLAKRTQSGRRKMKNKANRGWAGRDMDAANRRRQLP